MINKKKFRFIKFKHKTAAATAIEMFNNYKIGTRSLLVRFADQQNCSNQPTVLRSFQKIGSTSPNSLKQSEILKNQIIVDTSNEDGWTDVTKVPNYPICIQKNMNSINKSDASLNILDINLTRKKIAGRGILLKPDQESKKSIFI